MEVVLSALNRATPVRLSNFVGTSVSLFNLSRFPLPLSPRFHQNRTPEFEFLFDLFFLAPSLVPLKLT